ncbi:MAG: spermidine synthase [Mycobacterium leprae]
MGSFVCQGKSGAIIVREEGEYRRLYFGSTLQGGIRLDDPTACTLPITEGFQAIRAFRPEPPQQVLLIGLGAGEVVRSFLKGFPQAQIQAVELDPAVLDVARRHFALPGSRRLRVAIGDGYAFLMRSRERYDLIILDACGPDGIPPQFCTREFMHLAATRLNPRGMLAANLFDFGPDGAAPSEFARQAARRFPERHALRLLSPSYLNRLLFCGFLPEQQPDWRRLPPGVAAEEA